MIERWSRKTGFLDLVRDHSGVIAIEFALIVPIMLIIFFGSYEAASLVLAYMKLENAAETAADLVAQTTVNTAALQSSAFTGFTNAVEQVLSPLPTSGTHLKIAYASVTYSTGSPVIDWHYEFNNATALTIANISTSQNLANLGSETNGSTDSVIIVKLTYAYTSSFSHVLNSSYTLSEIAFNRPRYTNCVATYLNTGSVCPWAKARDKKEAWRCLIRLPPPLRAYAGSSKGRRASLQ